MRREQHTDWCVSWTVDLRKFQKNPRRRTVTQTARYKQLRDPEQFFSLNTTVLASMFSFPVVYRLVLNCQFWILLSSAASFLMLLWSLLPERLPSRLAVVVLSELYDILFWTIPVCSFLPKDRVQPYGSNYGVCSAISTPITLWIAHMVKFPCNSLTINGLLCVLACLLSQTLSDTIDKCLIFFVTYCMMSVHKNWFFFNGISPARCWSSGYMFYFTLLELRWTSLAGEVCPHGLQATTTHSPDQKSCRQEER